MKIAVTGATGLLGGAVLKYLASSGREVVGLGRNEAKLSQLSEDGFEMINCDILDVNAIENSIIGVDIWHIVQLMLAHLAVEGNILRPMYKARRMSLSPQSIAQLNG